MVMTEKNIVIVVGDLGAGGNFIKNLLLLDKSADWPIKEVDNRLEYFLNEIYPSGLKDNLALWVNHEYKLRTWKSKYDTDIADQYADINTEQVQQTSKTHKIIFLCHWPDVINKLKELYPDIKIVSVSANNFDEVLWQVKTYIDKRSIEKLQNFSFLENIEQEKKKYIKNHGIDAYYKSNAQNMVHIINDRSSEYKLGYNITISELLNGNVDKLVNGLNKYLDMDIPLTDAFKLYSAWQQLHNPCEDVNTFKWFEGIQ